MSFSNKELTKDWVKELLIGVGIFLTLFINFLSEVNLRQLAAEQIALIGFSLAPFMLALLFLSWAISKWASRWLTLSAFTLFPLLSVGFYLQHHYRPATRMVVALGDPFEDYLVNRLVVLGAFGVLWLAVILLGLRYSKLVRRTLAIFVTLLLVISIGPVIGAVRNSDLFLRDIQSNANTASEFIDESPLLLSTLNRPQVGLGVRTYPNVYFVIVDGMVSLQSASNLGIVEQDSVLAALQESGATYIEPTYSSYDKTFLTLSSVLSLSYVRTPESHSYPNTSAFFPFVMRSEIVKTGEKPRIPLLRYLTEIGVSFGWQGNSWAECIPSSKWSCVDRDVDMTNAMVRRFIDLITVVIPFYRPSVIGSLMSATLPGGGSGEHSLVKFMGVLGKLIENPKPRFFLVHHLAPHPPFQKNQDCDDVADRESFDGYRDNYLCTLKEINQFLSMIGTIDPKSIVVIQGDHGWEITDPANKSKTADRSSSIFNLVRAPDHCFTDYGTPSTTVNSIRFVLNCAYHFTFPFDEAFHYTSSSEGDARYGEVRLQEVKLVEVLNKQKTNPTKK